MQRRYVQQQIGLIYEHLYDKPVDVWELSQVGLYVLRVPKERWVERGMIIKWSLNSYF